MVRENAWYDFSFLEFVEACFVSYHVVCLWKCSICMWKKNVYFASLGWKVLYISVKSIWSRTLFNAAISLLLFCLEDLSIFDSGVLESLAVSTLLSISFLKSSKIFLMYLGAPMLDAYMFTMFMSSWWILPLSLWSVLLCLFLCPCFLKSLMSDISIATLAFFPYLLGIFFSNPSPSVCVGLLFWDGFLVGSICVGHVFLSIQISYVFFWS